MVNKRFNLCLEKRGLLTAHQCGYRSATYQLVYLDNALQNSFIEGKHMVATFFDLEKAFDKTWRYNIMKQLHIWRFSLPKFIPSFLRNRTFCFRSGNGQ